MTTPASLPPEEQDETATRVVELFKFYWQKFLSKQRILEEEELLLKKDLDETERQAKLQRIHDTINNN